MYNVKIDNGQLNEWALGCMILIQPDYIEMTQMDML